MGVGGKIALGLWLSVGVLVVAGSLFLHEPTTPVEGKSMLVNGKVLYCTAPDVFDAQVQQLSVRLGARFGRAEAERRAVMAGLATLAVSGNAPCVMGRKYDDYGNRIF